MHFAQLVEEKKIVLSALIFIRSPRYLYLRIKFNSVGYDVRGVLKKSFGTYIEDKV